MGWTGLTRQSGAKDDREFFAGQFSCSKIVDFSKVGNVCYMVLEPSPDKVANGAPHRYALVCVTEWRNSERHNFWYKDIDESMGPFDAECPLRLINLLPPTTNRYANEWRQRCRDNAAKRAVGRKKRKVEVGDILKFAHPLRFSDKTEHDTFEVEIFRKRKVFKAPNGMLYRISKFEKYEFEVLKKEAK